MNNYYLIGVVVFCIVIIIKLLYENHMLKDKLFKHKNFKIEKVKSFEERKNYVEKVTPATDTTETEIKTDVESNDYLNIELFITNKDIAKRRKRVKPVKKQEKNISIDQKKIEPEKVSKNKWLYLTDDFGEMKKGVVVEAKTYAYEISENRNDRKDDFEIQ